MKFWKKGPPILAISQLVHIGLSFKYINKTTHSEVFNFKSIYWLQYSNLNNSSRFLVYVINIFTYTSSHQTIAPDYIISPCFSLACNTLHLSPHTATRSRAFFNIFPQVWPTFQLLWHCTSCIHCAISYCLINVIILLLLFLMNITEISSVF